MIENLFASGNCEVVGADVNEIVPGTEGSLTEFSAALIATKIVACHIANTEQNRIIIVRCALQRRMWMPATILLHLHLHLFHLVSAQISQPDVIQEHWYHSYATLTLDLNAWADEHPDIVNLLVVGETNLEEISGCYKFQIGV